MTVLKQTGCIYSYHGVRGGPVVNVLDCQSIGSLFKSLTWANVWMETSAPPAPLANSFMMNTLTAYCQWEDETARERTGRPLSCAKAKNRQSLMLYGNGYLFSSSIGSLPSHRQVRVSNYAIRHDVQLSASTCCNRLSYHPVTPVQQHHSRSSSCLFIIVRRRESPLILWPNQFLCWLRIIPASDLFFIHRLKYLFICPEFYPADSLHPSLHSHLDVFA